MNDKSNIQNKCLEASLAGLSDTFQKSARRWEVIVYPSLFAFIVLAIYGFYLINSVVNDMHTIAKAMDPMMGQNMASFSVYMGNMSTSIGDMTDDIQLMSKTATEISTQTNNIVGQMSTMNNHVSNMNESVRHMNNSVVTMNRYMGQVTHTVGRMGGDMTQMTKPVSFMNSFMPW